MTGISSATSVRPYLALPSPESVRAVAGPGSSDTVVPGPVQPVPPVTRRAEQPEEDRRRSSNTAAGSNGAAGTGAAASASGEEGGAGSAGAAPSAPSASSSPLRFSLSSNGGGSIGFATQQLSQETVGAGLHIEPWQAALSSYRSADALSASSGRSRSTGLVV
ncbi:MAG: hypothetical protein WCF85_11495 [Rhodospirillaceae bacterium]